MDITTKLYLTSLIIAIALSIATYNGIGLYDIEAGKRFMNNWWSINLIAFPFVLVLNIWL